MKLFKPSLNILVKLYLKILHIVVFITAIITAIITAGFANSVALAVETVFWVDNQSGVAISGYDPISFFLSGQGRRGDVQYEYFWGGAVWRFENEGNLSAFRDSPLVYIPQFGGYDVVEMSYSKKVTPNPRFSDLYQNRLYLFHSQDSLDIWHKSKEKYIRSASRSWLNLNVGGLGKNFIVQVIKKDKPSAVTTPDIEFKTKQQLIDEKNAAVKTALADKNNDDALEDIASETIKMDSSSRMGAAGDHFKSKK
ncbi:MAG: hypothetical protein HRU28_10720 [Rhizobiales bacterium]|nr:hypothetical protein [Hyphomicrobiales bacterium]